MTVDEALDLIEQMRLQVQATGAVNDQLREAVRTVRAALSTAADNGQLAKA
jgi:hypothetical protein